MKITVIIITVNTITIKVGINYVAIPDFALADAFSRIEFIACSHHGFQPCHILFSTDHTVLRTTIQVNRTISIEVVAVSLVKVEHIVFVDGMSFEYALVTRDTVVQLDAPARFSQIFEEPLAEMVEMLQQRGFACALELGSEDVLLTVRAQYIRRILDNIGSNLIKYADPARPIEVLFLRQEGRAGLVFRNHVLPAPPAVESTKVGLTSIETMMDKMHADCKIEQENEQFTMTLLFPVE